MLAFDDSTKSARSAVEAGLKLVHYGGQKTGPTDEESKLKPALLLLKCNLLMVHLAAEVDQI